MIGDALPVLVLDAASCARADAAQAIAQALCAGTPLAVADVVFDRELRGRGGERLLHRGLRVESLPDIRSALALRRAYPHLSLGDAFSLALAAEHGWMLQTCSAALVRLAEERGVAVHDPQWRLPRVGDPRGVYGLRAPQTLNLK
jgi:hypothetical protein